MAFRKKLQSLIGKQDPRSLDHDFAADELVGQPAVALFKEHIHHIDMPNDPHADRDLLESIEADYYRGEEFDPSEFELAKLPEKLNLQEIDDDRTKLRKQLQVVSKKVSELVLENHPAYAAELQRVMELQATLQHASAICADGRSQLTLAKSVFTTASLGLLKNFRKRQQLIALLKSLRMIKTLQRTDIRLREMMEEEDYPGAIQLCLECQKAASTFKHYSCISELSSKLHDTLEMIEEQLDVALSKTCQNFDTRHYEKVQHAYRLLGKTQTAMDQLHMHFTSAIHNTAFTIVLGYVELTSGTADSNFQKRQYSDLCKHISIETFYPCLVDLCKALWEVMKSYYQTIEWHERQEQEAQDSDSNGSSVEAVFNRRYVKQKLEHGLERIWQDVQQKVKTYVLSLDMSTFKFDEFIQVLDIVNRLIQVGEEFCGSKSEGLQDSLRQQSVNYFRNYHRSRLDELRMFLENEGWELCPVKSNFSILQLQEYKFMRHRLRRTHSNASSLSQGSVKTSVFQKFRDQGSPFDLQAEEEEKEDVLATNGFDSEGFHEGTPDHDSDSDSDIPEELKQDYIDEQTGEVPAVRRPKVSIRRGSLRSDRLAPIVTNTTLNVIRLWGKYMQMMNVLKPISFDVIFCMSQLFDFYMYTVYSFFGSEYAAEDRELSNKLRTTLKRIDDNLILEDNGMDSMEERRDKVLQPHISPVVNLLNPDSLFGLPERVVAAESLVFLAEQFEFLKPSLEESIPQTKKAFLMQFYSQTVSTAQELRKPVYQCVTSRCLNTDQLLQSVSCVKWDIKDIMSQHNNYVDVILRELQVFSNRLNGVSRRVPLPEAVSKVMWEHVIGLANRTLVEGYASAKKCTNEGRALMQLDFQQLLMKLEKLTNIRPIPEREFVDAYIKAYYLPETQLELWVRDRREYSPKQLISLINCVDHINKRGRQRLVAMVEESANRR